MLLQVIILPSIHPSFHPSIHPSSSSVRFTWVPHISLCISVTSIYLESPSSHRLADHLCTSGTFVGVSVAFFVCDSLDYIHPLVWTWGEKDCLDCHELSGIVKDCHTHVMTVLLRLKGADATDYSWCWWILWDRTLHSWRYIYIWWR